MSAMKFSVQNIRNQHGLSRLFNGRFWCVFALILMGFIYNSSAALAQEVEAEVKPKKVRPGDYFTYTISAQVMGNEMINVHGDPQFDASFQISGRTNAPGMMIRNGQTQRTLTRTYRLRANREGTFTIKAPTVRIGNRTIVADPVTVSVTGDAPALPDPSARDTRPGQPNRQRPDRQRPGDPFGSRQPFDARPDNEPDDKKLFVSHKLQPTTRPYVGQQITLTYWLFSDAFRMSISPQPPDEPSLDEFWIEDLSREYAGQRRSTQVDGRHMLQTNLRAYALFGLKAGKVEIEPLELDVFTGGMLRAQEQIRLKSEPIQVEVRPLPPDAPAGFVEGNVGDWKLEVTTNKIRAQMGQTITVRVRVRGAGQADRLTLPKLPEIPGLHVAGREQRTNNEVENGLVGGERIAEYTLIAEQEGELTIPGVEFVYFDPEAESYESVQSEPITITIQGGEAKPEVEDKEPKIAEKPHEGNLLDSLRSQLPTTRDDVKTTSNPKRNSGSDYLFLGILLLPIMGLLGLWLERPIRRRAAREAPRHKRGDAYKKALNYLSESAGAQPAQKLDAVRNAVRTYAVEVAQVPAGAVTPERLPAQLKSRGVNPEHAQALADILARVNSLRYAPTLLDGEGTGEGQSGAEALRQACDDCLKSLENARKKGSWKSSAALWIAGSLGVMMVAATLAGPSVAWAETPDAEATPVARAIAAQKKARDIMQQTERPEDARAHWQRAARAWGEALEKSPNNPDFLFNQSLAFAHDDDWGHARLAIERAALLAPRDKPIATAREQIQRISHLHQIETARGSTSDATHNTTEGLFWWQLATSIPNSLFPTLFALLLWAVFGVALARRFVSNPAAQYPLKLSATLVGAALLLCALGWFAREQIVTSTHPAVVLSDDIKLRDGPSQHAGLADVRTLLVPGCLIPTSAQKDGWIRLDLDDDTHAWARAEELGFVISD